MIFYGRLVARFAWPKLDFAERRFRQLGFGDFLLYLLVRDGKFCRPVRDPTIKFIRSGAGHDPYHSALSA